MANRSGLRRAFTMVEIMFAVLILSILLGLLIGGVKMATRLSKGTVDRQAVNSIRTGATQFRQLFGFGVPLVRERAQAPANDIGVYVQLPQSGANQRNHVCIYRPDDPLDPNNYLAEMRGGSYLTTLRSSKPNNPFVDYRYSERSLAIYLVGQSNVPLVPGQQIPPDKSIDGVPGPGFFRPNPDGSFAIPADILRLGSSNPPTGSVKTNRASGVYDSLIDVNANAPKLLVDPGNVPGGPGYDATKVMIVDRNNIPIRYYRWEPQQAVAQLTDLNVPALVGRKFRDVLLPDLMNYAPPADRDLEKSPNIKGATFAIVAAGPDGFFGDEDDLAPAGSPERNAFERMMIAAGFAANDVNPADIVKARVKAEEDNIVEVGQ